jgi:HPt (histidine-containing phosphotransfer) domain-containing protein
MDSVDAQMPQAPPPADVKDLLDRCLGKIEIAERILRTFQRTLDEDLQQLEQSLLAADVRQTIQIAHRIKGASLAAGAHELKEHAQRLETSAARGMDDTLACFQRLQEARARFRKAATFGPACGVPGHTDAATEAERHSCGS